MEALCLGDWLYCPTLYNYIQWSVLPTAGLPYVNITGWAEGKSPPPPPSRYIDRPCVSIVHYSIRQDIEVTQRICILDQVILFVAD